MRPIIEVAEDLGLSQEQLDLYGKYKGKIRLQALQDNSSRKMAKLILVTAMTPTPHGEGKTVTSIGLGMGLSKAGHKSVICLRQPSLGPVFGVKGGATGGGKSRVEPSDDINLRFTGDLDAVAAAHNLLAAMADNHLFHGNELGIDPQSLEWQRTLDVNDRALRNMIVGLGGRNGIPRETGFLITAASEVLAVLSLARSYSDLKVLLSQIIVGFTRNGQPVTAGQLKATGAMAVLLRDALEPNLVQTTEGTPAMVHGGCFGNIAQGTSTITSMLMGMQRADYCVVEAGFGSDLGAEKFVDIVAPAGRLKVDAAVVVASIRALKHHGGDATGTQGSDVAIVRRGLGNLEKHLENVKILGMNPVVAINKFETDTREELRAVENFSEEQRVPFAISTCFENGSEGALELTDRVVEAAAGGSSITPLYRDNATIEEKLQTITTRIYGGDGIELTAEARRDLKHLALLGFSNRPVCVAKTPLSLSDDPAKLGRPRGFRAVVKGIRAAAGAGYSVAEMGDILMMPGLPKRPAAENIDLDSNGVITGLQ